MEAKKSQKPVVFSVSPSTDISRGDELLRPVDTTTYATLRAESWHRFGSDNLFPQAIAYLNRKSPVHRGIINSRARYIKGGGFTVPDGNQELKEYLKSVNANNDTLRKVFGKLALDKISSGNAYMEVVTNAQGDFVNLYHHDFTTARAGKDDMKDYILLHPNWARVELEKKKLKQVPKWPQFEDTEGDGNLRSMVHFKVYEPEFTEYGVPDWIAGLSVSAIAYKTDKWNISRLDNSFNSSGVFLVDGDFNSDEEAEELKEEVKQQYTGEGNTGKILFIAKSLGGAQTSYTPITQDHDGDWTQLHQQSGSDLIIAHGWFRSLVGFADNTGFDTERILNEWQVAKNTVIPELQEDLLEPITEVLQQLGGMDTEGLGVINKPPLTKKPGYMYVWEARKADGLDYDPEDPAQQVFLENLKPAPKSLRNGQ